MSSVSRTAIVSHGQIEREAKEVYGKGPVTLRIGYARPRLYLISQNTADEAMPWYSETEVQVSNHP